MAARQKTNRLPKSLRKKAAVQNPLLATARRYVPDMQAARIPYTPTDNPLIKAARAGGWAIDCDPRVRAMLNSKVARALPELARSIALQRPSVTVQEAHSFLKEAAARAQANPLLATLYRHAPGEVAVRPPAAKTDNPLLATARRFGWTKDQRKAA